MMIVSINSDPGSGSVAFLKLSEPENKEWDSGDCGLQAKCKVGWVEPGACHVMIDAEQRMWHGENSMSDTVTNR
jgi:hypothetical protein